jgi:DNA (cytosine-5)-methyltransferase 1
MNTHPETLNELALFAGAGGGILGGLLCGFRTVCAVEVNDYARRVLLARQDDGSLHPFPIWDDVRTFDGKPWRGLVDIITGGFPCQDISAAGKGAGIDGARSGLWGEMARIIGEVGPRYVLVENSPNLTSRGLGRVLGDLAALGYDARWGVLGAVHAGAPHKRDRIWIRCELADTGCAGRATRRAGSRSAPHGEILNVRTPDSGEALANAGGGRCCGAQSGEMELAGRAEAVRPGEAVADANGSHEYRRRRAVQMGRKWSEGQAADDGERCGTEWCPEPDVGRVAHGVAARVDRLTAIGNGQVPRVVALAWRILSKSNAKNQAP